MRKLLFFTQWELGIFLNGKKESSATLTNLAGESWKYSYPVITDEFGYITFVQRWTDDEKYVLFSPANGYGTSRVYGLFQMDLANGNVISLLGNDKIVQPFYVQYHPMQQRQFTSHQTEKHSSRTSSKNSEISFNIGFENDEAIENFIWSPDETMVVLG